MLLKYRCKIKDVNIREIKKAQRKRQKITKKRLPDYHCHIIVRVIFTKTFHIFDLKFQILTKNTGLCFNKLKSNMLKKKKMSFKNATLANASFCEYITCLSINGKQAFVKKSLEYFSIN